MSVTDYLSAKDDCRALLDEERLVQTREWISPTRVRPHYLWSVLLLGLLFISVTLNIRTSLQSLTRETKTVCRSSYSGLEYDVLTQFEDDNDYYHDTPLATSLWRNISLQGLVVALSTDSARELELESSQVFPWDTNRQLYYVKGFHDIHCLKLMRHAYLGLLEHGTTEIEKHHLLHCFEAFRQDIMCTADDTLLPYSASHLGAGKNMVCRDWQKLQEWATQEEFDSCWDIMDEYRPIAHSLERYSHCDPNSRYRAVQERYFELHGHKPAFKDEM